MCSDWELVNEKNIAIYPASVEVNVVLLLWRYCYHNAMLSIMLLPGSTYYYFTQKLAIEEYCYCLWTSVQQQSREQSVRWQFSVLKYQQYILHKIKQPVEIKCDHLLLDDALFTVYLNNSDCSRTVFAVLWCATDSGVIVVQAALYGRADRETCSEGRPPQQLTNTECSQTGTLDVLKTRYHR